MEPKPSGWGDRYAAVFRDPGVVANYHLRPPYPDETFELLARLAAGGPVLDAGCGPGDLARPLAPRVERVDAVDVSAAMLARGRGLPGGDAPNLRWIAGPIEHAPLDPPYSLVTAGDSVHWFDWQVALPRLAEVVAGPRLLAVVHRDWLRDERARERLAPIYARHSWNADFAPLDPVEELERRGLFQPMDRWESAPAPWRPTVDEAVDSHFSMSGFAPARLRDPYGFATEVREVLAELPTAPDGGLELDVTATVVWGRPAAGAGQ